MNNDNSGVNTIILVLILALIVFGMVWYFKSDVKTAPQEEGVNVELNLPTTDKDTDNSQAQ